MKLAAYLPTLTSAFALGVSAMGVSAMANAGMADAEQTNKICRAEWMNGEGHTQWINSSDIDGIKTLEDFIHDSNRIFGEGHTQMQCRLGDSQKPPTFGMS